jgi:hypothetical protein
MLVVPPPRRQGAKMLVVPPPRRQGAKVIVVPPKAPRRQDVGGTPPQGASSHKSGYSPGRQGAGGPPRGLDGKELTPNDSSGLIALSNVSSSLSDTSGTLESYDHFRPGTPLWPVSRRLPTVPPPRPKVSSFRPHAVAGLPAVPGLDQRFPSKTRPSMRRPSVGRVWSS